MHEYTSSVDYGNNESLLTILSKNNIGEDNFNRLFEFTQEQYTKLGNRIDLSLSMRFVFNVIVFAVKLSSL